MARLLIFILLSFPFLVQAGEELWKDNKLTPSQPFPGRVLAVESGWGGYRLVIESVGDGDKKYCIAQVWPGGLPHLEYKEILKRDLPQPGVMIVFLNPSIEVDHFSWSMGPWKIGRIFGNEDCLKRVIAMELDRSGAGNAPKQPATAGPKLHEFKVPKSSILFCEDQAEAERRWKLTKEMSTADVYLRSGTTPSQRLTPILKSAVIRTIGGGTDAEPCVFGVDVTDAQRTAIEAALAKDQLFIIYYHYGW